jgi:hypothetical protein
MRAHQVGASVRVPPVTRERERSGEEVGAGAPRRTLTPVTAGTVVPPTGGTGFRPFAGWEEFVPVLVGSVLVATLVIAAAALGAWLHGRAVRREASAAVDDPASR